MFRAYVMVPILYIRIRLMVTNDPKAMSFLLMNALVYLVMLHIIVFIHIGQCAPVLPLKQGRVTRKRNIYASGNIFLSFVIQFQCSL